MRTVLSIVASIVVTIAVGTWLSAESRAQSTDKGSITGIWVRNRDLSEPPSARGERDGERGRGEFGRGRMGRGGFGGRAGRVGGRGDGHEGNPEEIARMREAMRDIIEPGDRLTITQTETMVVITAEDGRTTRLSPNGQKVKDDNTRIERKTRWDASKLVSEITGAGGGKITQTFSVEGEPRQLRIVAQIEGRNDQRRTVTHVYDPDQR